MDPTADHSGPDDTNLIDNADISMGLQNLDGENISCIAWYMWAFKPPHLAGAVRPEPSWRGMLR